MADKNDVFVLARRREDGVVMVLGRKLIAEYPHEFEEIRSLSSKATKVTKATVAPVSNDDSDADITMAFSTEAGFTEPESIDEYRAALDVLEVEYKPQHGLPGLRKLYEENK